MVHFLALTVPIALLAFLTFRARRIWRDTGLRRLSLIDRLRWTCQGALQPSRYWWQARIDTLSLEERQELLIRGSHEIGLGRADSVRCPLCKEEVPNAWAITETGETSVARRPVECPRCDFRLDACRHCRHFLPGSPAGWGQPQFGSVALSFGRCPQYKEWLPIDQTTSAEMARRLRARGYERIRAPRLIQDSFLPPDSCISFLADRKRLRGGGIAWPDARQSALIRMLQCPTPLDSPVQQSDSDYQEKWLL
jgi:hypothetical protein